MRPGPACSAGGAEAQETAKGDVIILPQTEHETLRTIRAYGTAAGLDVVLRTKAGPRTAYFCGRRLLQWPRPNAGQRCITLTSAGGLRSSNTSSLYLSESWRPEIPAIYKRLV